MKQKNKLHSFLLTIVLLFNLLSVPGIVHADQSAGGSSFHDDFEVDVTTQWDGATSHWSWVTEDNRNVMRGNMPTVNINRNTIIRAEYFSESNTDYTIRFSAKTDNRFRLLFRHTATGTTPGNYFLEFKSGNSVECWNGGSKIGSTTNISTIISGFTLSSWHEYRVDVISNTFTLTIDGVPIAIFTDTANARPHGTVGFGIRVPSGTTPSTTNVFIDNVSVTVPDVVPPSAPVLSLADHTDTTAELSWTASTDNIGVTGYVIYSDHGVSPLDTVSGSVYQHTMTGLTPATPYSFTVRAKDSAGNLSTTSNVIQVTTHQAVDQQQPTAPTNVTVVSKTYNSAQLSWTASTDNIGVIAYDIYVNQGTSPQATVSSSVYQHTVSELTPATSYSFYVKARDGAGNVSASSNSVQVTTEALPDAQGPVITHTPVTQVNVTVGATIQASIVDPSGISEAKVFYRYGTAQEGVFQSISMAKGEGNLYFAIIPGGTVKHTMNYYIEAIDSMGNKSTTLFADDFSDSGYTGKYWTAEALTNWTLEDEASNSYYKAATSHTRTFASNTNGSQFMDYDFEFKGKFNNKGVARPSPSRAEFYVRADGGNYYAVEADTNGNNEVLFKIHRWNNLTYISNLTANVTYTYDPTEWHNYRVSVRGNKITLFIDDQEIISAIDPDSHYTSGYIGFRSHVVGLVVDHVAVSYPVEVTGFNTLNITHQSQSNVSYNADVPVQLSVSDTGSPVTATLNYKYGNDLYKQMTMVQDTNKNFIFNIQGTNCSSSINYYITAEDGDGRSARYPAEGDVSVSVGSFERYYTDFEQVASNTVPQGWTVFGDAKVIQLPEQNKVLELNGMAGQANVRAILSDSRYSNIDNFILKFRARYERTSIESYNVWRLRYRTKDGDNNYAVEWGTHNWRYFIMRKTTLGGNYFVGTYNESLEKKWVDYEVHVSGITHQLYIDGKKVIHEEDSDVLRIDKGTIEFGTVAGMNLKIDHIEIIPMEQSYIYFVEPSGNYTGVYAAEQQKGIQVQIDGGSQNQKFTVAYSVKKAGSSNPIVEGTKDYHLTAYEKLGEPLYFSPNLSEIGTYDVTVDLYVDDVKAMDKSKSYRITVIKQVASKPEIDMDMESKFGFNTHYKMNWRDDLMEAVRKIGARHHRSGISWADVDQNQGTPGNRVYNFSALDQYIAKVESFGLNQIPVLSFLTNPHYQSGENTVNTWNGLKALEEFVHATVTRYKNRIRHWESPNEPELSAKPYIPYEVVQQWKRAYVGMKRADLDAVFIAGDHTSSVRSILPKELELGAYDYADALSWHPYVYNAMPDGAIQSFINDTKNMVNQYGGWKDYYLTEGGWPTAKGGHPNVSEETQRDYIVRAFLTYLTQDQLKAWEYYNFKNDGTDENYYEVFWGITDHNGRPKLAYAAINNMMTTLDGAEYVGRLNTGDNKVVAHVFLDGNKPVIVTWRLVDHKDNPQVNPLTSQLSIPITTSAAKVSDINGEESTVQAVNGNIQVAVSGSPIYITEVGSEILYSSAMILFNDKYVDAIDKMNALLSASNSSKVEEFKQELTGSKGGIETSLSMQSVHDKAEGIELGIKSIYTLMKKIAAYVKENPNERAKGYVAMEALYNYAETVSKSLIYLKSQTLVQAVDVDCSAKVENAGNTYIALKGDHGLMPVSTAAVMRARRYERLAWKNKERGQHAESFVYNLLAGEFALVAKAMAESEPVKWIGIWANVAPVKINREQGSSAFMACAVVNDTQEDQTIEVDIMLPNGWNEAQAGVLRQSAVLQAGEGYTFNFAVNIPSNIHKGLYKPTVLVKKGNMEVERVEVELRVDDAINAKILPVTKSVNDLDEVVVKLTGTSDMSKSGKIILKGPDGKILAPKTVDTFTNLEKDQELSLAFQWEYRTVHDFNRYLCELIVVDAANGLEIFSDPSVPIDFILVQKVQHSMTMDGNLNDWKDAFPVNLRGASRNASGSYDAANLESIAYAKWDEDHFYIAVEVRDDIHKNSEDAPNLWKNDSLQVSFDPLNDSSANYGEDDMEWGFAMRNDGTLLANIFFSRPPNPNGNMSENLPFAIIRDEENKKTYYEIKIPVSMMKDFLPAEGALIAHNLAVNDSDHQAGRDNYVQWTRGLAESKKPNLYDKFMLVNEFTPNVRPQYQISVTENQVIYTAGQTADGIKTMTVKEGVQGLQNFAVSITPLVSHPGTETVVFIHLRNGVQVTMNATSADYDADLNSAYTGFNVQAGDVVKVYIVDQLTHELTVNPIILM